MLSVKEASQRLRVSTSLVYTLCSRGILDHFRIGMGRGAIRIDEKALEAYLDRSKVIVRSCPQGLGNNFRQLDSARLTEAWKKQGVL